MGDKEWDKKFDKCPVCGSKDRYYESILKEAQEKGWIDKKVECFDSQLHEGIPIPAAKIATLPIGTEIQTFKRIWDVCCSCGIVYTVVLSKGKVKTTLMPALSMPNRAERRRMESAGIHLPPGVNDPRYS